ncbi:MAG: TetR/AcrR family transcriptional regulator [Clostridium sp.]|nr:TetR/AcrR family transcriptional regulator [Lachnoclostridium sp.]MCM1253034.1 TetR/AcrR family transcriptional regulator [Clostridium sp.]
MAENEYLPKEKAIYQAVVELFEEGADLNSLTVSEITKRAGIGKGTAYEYFSDKEEMIAKALFYNTKIFCTNLYKGMMEKESFYTKIDFLLLTMEEEIANTNCVVRLMMMSDNSMLSRRMRELCEEKKSSGEMPVMDIIWKIIGDEFQSRQTPSDERMEYLVMSIFSKILCFAMWMGKGMKQSVDERNAMRKLVTEGICREVVFLLK